MEGLNFFWIPFQLPSKVFLGWLRSEVVFVDNVLLWGSREENVWVHLMDFSLRDENSMFMNKKKSCRIE